MARRNYLASNEQCANASSSKKRRRFGSLQEHSMDRIDIFSAGRLELDEVERTWIPAVDWSTAAMPILAPVPLLHPNELLRVSATEKSRIMQSATRLNVAGNAVDFNGGSDPDADDDMQEVILYHGDRHPFTYAESFKIFNADRAVFLTVGNGTGIKGAMLSRTRCTAVFNNALHKKIVMEDSRSHLPLFAI